MFKQLLGNVCLPGVDPGCNCSTLLFLPVAGQAAFSQVDDDGTSYAGASILSQDRPGLVTQDVNGQSLSTIVDHGQDQPYGPLLFTIVVNRDQPGLTHKLLSQTTLHTSLGGW